LPLRHLELRCPCLGLHDHAESDYRQSTVSYGLGVALVSRIKSRLSAHLRTCAANIKMGMGEKIIDMEPPDNNNRFQLIGQWFFTPSRTRARREESWHYNITEAFYSVMTTVRRPREVSGGWSIPCRSALGGFRTRMTKSKVGLIGNGSRNQENTVPADVALHRVSSIVSLRRSRRGRCAATVPSQSLPSALLKFSATTNQDLAVDFTLTGTLKQGALLTGTGLTYRFTSAGAVTLVGGPICTN
jgi:hypothetical protein